ncbi:MAG: SDR family NAD(P)-dependent oxidoreductase [Propionibacteriaceae bacterium]|nr:SDR family NAD(P)-dependent oxidoreductase [Propionibacteriaceae bacterium]
MAHKPAAVVIAGGRQVQGKRFEAAGIAAFLHVPAATLLDTYLKDGARRFIFEGRESGGHVGPLPSTVLWEKQLLHLLDIDEPQTLTVFFAGGIFDELSSAFVTIMAASLAARGAKIGALMGTAYLLTTEAVATGAITQTFQDLAVSADRTVLLESAPGQETRALPTPFADFFQAEKARIAHLDLEPLAKRLALEELNLGRARVAAKGQDRLPGSRELYDLTIPDQVSRGLFMVGSDVALMQAARTMRELHVAVCDGAARLVAQLPAVVDVSGDLTQHLAPDLGDRSPDEPIAVIGMAGLFPDAGDVNQFWCNNLMGRDSVTEVPEHRWKADLFYNPDTTDSDFVASKWGAFLSPAQFDPVEFGITPNSVGSIEPTQLLSLLVAKRALEDAGYGDRIKAGFADTSVVFGAESMGELSSGYGSRPGVRRLFGDLPQRVSEALPKLDEDSFPGVLGNVIAGRIANRLNCDGRNFTVDAACASSLAAVDVACQELWSNRSRMVICGGVDLHNSIIDYILFSATHALSRRGYCATFDESGDGLVLGEGVGAVILKRLSDAERDGDRIYALIRGVGGSSDGRSLGLTAPNMAGQTKALKRAYRDAGILAGQVGMIEAHGTGTAVGDRTELRALTRVFEDGGAVPGQTWLGSVKTQVGHTKCAAGVAGLIRSVLAVRHGVIPPTLHLAAPVKGYKPEESPFVFNASGHATLWDDDVRIAGISGLGFGGTNFHVVVQNYEAKPRAVPAAAWARELFLVRGDSLTEAQGELGRVARLWELNHEIRLADVAYTLATQSDKPVQIAIVSGSWPKFLAKAQAAAQGAPVPGVYYREPVPGKVGFLFSGQGSQQVNMARDLFVLFPWLRTELAQHPAYRDILFPPTVFTEAALTAQRRAVTDTRNAQPLLGFVDLALAKLLTEFGVAPDAVAGHSYGELPALAYAGVIPEADLPGLSRARAEAILGAAGPDPGAMAAIAQPSPATEALLTGRDGVWAVNFNSPDQVVVGGTTAAVETLLADCAANGVKAQRLDVACAFHTPLLAGADTRFADYLAGLRLGEPTVPVWSNASAALYPVAAAAIKQRLAEHLVSPVRFAEELQAMFDDGVRVFIEAGPGNILTGLVGATLPGAVAIPTEAKAGYGLRAFLRALAQYAVTGREIAADKLFAGRGVVALDLDAPTTYATTATTWMVDGYKAVPIATWREQGERHRVQEPIYTTDEVRRLTEGEAMSEPSTPQTQPVPVPSAAAPAVPVVPQPGPREQLVYAYLANMRVMLDDQRDIMLASLGYGTGQPGPVQPAEPVYALAPQPLPAMAPPPPLPVFQPVPSFAAPAPVAAPVPVAVPVPPPPAPAATPSAPPAVAVAPPPVAPAPAPAPEPAPTSGLLQVEDLSPDQMKDLILGVLSEKTGYPVDMLGLDQDLEADLSVDSIKRLEIIAALGERVDIPEPDTAEDADSALAEMAKIKTLRGMVEWLQSVKSQGAGEGDAGPKASEDAGATSVPVLTEPTGPAALAPVATRVPITRLVAITTPYPFGEPQDIAGWEVAVTDGSEALPVCVELAKRSAVATVVRPGESLGDRDALVFVRGPGWGLKELFDLLKSADLTTLRRLVVFDDTVGQLIASPEPPDLTRLEGFPGFVKTLVHEYPELRCKTVTGRTPFGPEFPVIAVQELVDQSRYPEVAYEDATRHRVVPTLTQAAGAARPGAGLDSSSVVLVLGGAQGISPELFRRVAATVPGRYVLVGRTPRNEGLAGEYAQLATREAVQQHLIRVEQMTDPKAVAQKVQAIQKAKSVEEAIAKIASTGASASYASLNVHDAAALRGLIGAVKREFGHVDAVFHAAAVLEDKLFRDKTWESFERVYTTKTDPLTVIGELIPEVKLVVFFSSMAAAFGNRGQCDYAAANSVFDQVAMVQATRPGARVTSIAWGPWQGAGLVSPTLEAEMRRRGLELLPLDEGSRFFVNELVVGDDPAVMALAGQEAKIQSFIATSLPA